MNATHYHFCFIYLFVYFLLLSQCSQPVSLKPLSHEQGLIPHKALSLVIPLDTTGFHLISIP